MLETKFHYEYECINHQDEVVASGDFYLNLPVYNIRNKEIAPRGYLKLFELRRDIFEIYRGLNHLKKIKLKVTNTCTKSVRFIE